MAPRNNPSRSQIARARDQRQVITETRQLTISSAFPPPADLERYEALFPTFTERLMLNFEAQGEHRRDVELRWVKSDNRRRDLSQIGGWIIYMTVLLGSFWLISLGQVGLGAAGVIANLVVLAGSWIGRRIANGASKGS